MFHFRATLSPALSTYVQFDHLSLSSKQTLLQEWMLKEFFNICSFQYDVTTYLLRSMFLSVSVLIEVLVRNRGRGCCKCRNVSGIWKRFLFSMPPPRQPRRHCVLITSSLVITALGQRALDIIIPYCISFCCFRR